MTRIERVLTSFAGGVPDRIPVMAHNFMMAVSEAGTTHRAYRVDPEVMARTLEDSVERYDLDGVLLDVDTALLASACGADVTYPDDAPADVFEAAKKVCDLYRGKGGLVLCSGCALGPNTKGENLQAFVNAGHALA